jgi:hypothetical protein
VSSLTPGSDRHEVAAATVELECGSVEEVARRGEWLSRLMFGWMLPSDLAYRESRSYEAWLADQEALESASPLRALDPANGATGGEAGLHG